MISYKPFWETLKRRGMKSYTLINRYNISSSTIQRIRENKPLTTTTIDDLCKILQCGVDGIVCHLPEGEADEAEAEDAEED